MDKHIQNDKNNPINYEQTQKERNNIIICETLERLFQKYLPDLDTPLNATLTTSEKTSMIMVFLMRI